MKTKWHVMMGGESEAKQYPFQWAGNIHHTVFEECIGLKIKGWKSLKAFEKPQYLDFFISLLRWKPVYDVEIKINLSLLPWIMKAPRMMETPKWCLKCANYSHERPLCAHLILSATLPALSLSLYTALTEREGEWHAQGPTVWSSQNPAKDRNGNSIFPLLSLHLWAQEHFWGAVSPNLGFHVTRRLCICIQ